MNKQSMSKSSKVLLGLVSILIFTPLLIYTNCGTVPDPMAENNPEFSDEQTALTQTTSTLPDANDGEEKLDSAGNFIPSSGTYIECKQWEQEAYIKPSNLQSQDRLGYAHFNESPIRLNGSLLVVGSPLEASNQDQVTNGTASSSDNSAYQAGATYAFRLANNQWTQEAYLKAANSDEGDFFGSALASSGSVIVVAAPFEDSNQTGITNGPTASLNNSATDSGAVYVYRRVNGQWIEEAYLKKPAGYDGGFGPSVAVSENRIAIAGNNRIYIYTRTGNLWNYSATIQNPGTSGDEFGSHIAMSGSKLVVSAPQDDSDQTIIINGQGVGSNNNAMNAGSVYVYSLTNGQWIQEAYLKPSNAEANDKFGDVVSISGNRIAVSALGEDSNQTTISNGLLMSLNNTASNSGAVYVFSKVNNLWVQEAYIKPSNTGAGDGFGTSISLSGNRLVVGAPHEDSNQTSITNGSSSNTNNLSTESGAAYVYARVNNLWKQEAYIKPSNAGQGDFFGYGVAVYGNRLAVVAYQEDGGQTSITNGAVAPTNNNSFESGAAYVFVCKGGTLGTITQLP